MAEEKPVADEAIDRAHRVDLSRRCWANDRAWGKIRADELTGNGKDQVGLKQGVFLLIKIRKEEPIRRIGEGSNRWLHAISREVHPFQEVTDLVSPDAERDLQNFSAGNLLTESRVQTRSGLLDESKVERRCIGDCLDMVFGSEIRVGSRDRGKLSRLQRGQCLSEIGSKIGIGRAAISNIPTGIYTELREVREASDLLRSRRLAARQSSESIQVHRFFALGDQVRVQEGGVALFIERVRGNVLRTIPIQGLESQLVRVLSSVRNSTQFCILLPEIGLDQALQQPVALELQHHHG